MRNTSHCFFASTWSPLPSMGNVADRLFNANAEAICFVGNICLGPSENQDLFFLPNKKTRTEQSQRCLLNNVFLSNLPEKIMSIENYSMVKDLISWPMKLKKMMFQL